MLHISTIEQAAPRAYIRTLFFYQLPENYSKDTTSTILREGLTATLKSIPLLSAEIVLNEGEERKQRGKLTIRPSKFTHFYEADYRHGSSFPWTYEQLKRKNFPTGPLSGELLFPWSNLPDLTTAKPVFGVQANFIDGGLILGLCISHNKADARAIYEITRVWSHHCRDLQNDPSRSPSPLRLDPEVFADEPMTLDSDGDKSRGSGSIKSHPEYIISESPSIPPGLLKDNVRTKVYYFSSEKLKELKIDSTPTDGSSWVSTNDALTALMWSSIVAAQVKPDARDLSRGSFNSVCVDGRLRSSPKLSPHYIGCTMFLVTPWAPTESIVNHDLKSLSKTVHKSIEAVDPEYIDSIVRLHNSVPDYSRIDPASFPGLVDNSVFLTAWQKVPFYEVNWGPFMGGHCESIRTAWTGFFNGTAVAMPTSPDDGGIEVIIGLEEQNFEKFDNDGTWTKYATNRT